MSDQTTPQQVTKSILSFCKKLEANAEPIFVNVRPTKSAAPADCHKNVRRHVEEFGGSIQFGWVIWESLWTLEAEFHSVWKTPDGDLVDITPTLEGETHLLFQPDHARRFDYSVNRPIRTQTTAKIVDPLVDLYIAMQQETNGYQVKRSKVGIFQCATALKSVYGRLLIKFGSATQQAEGSVLIDEAGEASKKLLAQAELLPYAFCPCGSGKKFKFCCKP